MAGGTMLPVWRAAMSTVRGILRALLVLAVAVPAVAHADIPPPDLTACYRATEGAPCCGGRSTCVLSQCTYYGFAYSRTDAAIPFVPVTTVRDAAYSDAETGGDAGPTYPQWTWYPCLSCAGVSWTLDNCTDAGLPGVRAPSDGSAPSNTVDAAVTNTVDSAVTGGANQPDSPGSGKRGGGCVVGGWLSARALAPWALAGLFATLVTVFRRRRPKGH
jgi:hypothetical protein